MLNEESNVVEMAVLFTQAAGHRASAPCRLRTEKAGLCTTVHTDSRSVMVTEGRKRKVEMTAWSGLLAYILGFC